MANRENALKRATTYIGIGSNLGDREANVQQALENLNRLPDTQLEGVSSLFESQPVCCGGGWFLNAVAQLSTALPPKVLLQACLDIEKRLGRVRMPSSIPAPRVIDLDILLYEDFVLSVSDLQIPHPRMHERRFVLAPLRELAPDRRHPLLLRTVEELFCNLRDDYKVKKLAGVANLDSSPGS